MAGSIITFSGKGGVGKTSLASMTLRQLIRIGRRPVLAVDADPNATLGLTLGVAVEGTLADLREEMEEAAQKPSEISKTRLMDHLLSQLLVEESGFDLLTMGRPEGAKCYCYVNGLLRRYLSLLRENYAYILVDCEAGMEYISRLIVDDVESIIFVAEPTPIGLITAQRIAALADSLKVKVGRRVLVLNKIARGGAALTEAQRLDLTRFDAVIEVPFDPDVAGRCLRGEPIDDAAGNDCRAAIEELTERALGASSARV